MNKGSTKLLVIVGLIALVLCSWYTLINETAKVNSEYNRHITTARKKAEADLHQVALENYELARAVKDSIELRDEMANVYKEFGNESLYESFCEQIIEDYPFEKIGYEHLASLYNDTGSYDMFYTIKKSAEKRGLNSKKINELAKKSEYAYNLDSIDAEEMAGYSAGCRRALRSNGFWGFLGNQGATALSFSYVKLSDYANDVAFAELQNGEYVLIDLSGKIVSRVADDRKIEDCTALSEEKMAVKYDGKYHYCNDSFEELFGAYDAAGIFVGDVAAVMKDGKWGVINGKGEQIADFSFEEIKLDDVGIAFRNDRGFAKKDGKYILVDSKGKQIGKSTWDDVDAFGNEMIAAVMKDGKWGFIDADGKELAPCQYEGAKSAYNGMAAVKKGGQWGFISTKDMKIKIEPAFDEALDFTNSGTVFVKKDSTWYALRIYSLS